MLDIRPGICVEATSPTAECRRETCHRHEVFPQSGGTLHYRSRAVDQHGSVLDILVQDGRNASAAERFFKRPPSGVWCKPTSLVADGLRSYDVAKRERLPGVEHRMTAGQIRRARHMPVRIWRQERCAEIAG